MEKNITLTFGNLNGEQAIKLTQIYGELANNLSMTATATAPAPTAPAKEKAAKPKTEKAPAAPAPEPAPEENFDLGEETPAAEPEITLEQVVAGFQKFAKDHGRDKAGRILGSYGVKSVRDLPKEKYSDVMKKLSK